MVLNLVLNALLICLICSGAYLGYKRGFIAIAAKPVKIFAAIAITLTCCSSVGEALVKPIIDEPITNYVADYLYDNCAEITQSNVSSELPTILKLAAGLSGISVEDVAGEAQSNGKAIVDAIADVLSDPVITIISVVIAFIIVYIAAKIILSMLFAIINYSVKGGLLGYVNKLVGTLFGLICAIIICWGSVAVLEFVFHSQICVDNPTFFEFEGVFLYALFKNYNPIELLLSF